MRHILCGPCSKEKKPGRRLALHASLFEPAEYERVVKGIARIPRIEQRKITVNDVAIPLPLDYYNCDSCNDSIVPESAITAWTVWTERQQEPAEWETAFLKESMKQ